MAKSSRTGKCQRQGKVMRKLGIVLILFCFACGGPESIPKTFSDASVPKKIICEDSGPNVICHKVKAAGQLYIICENLDASTCSD